MSENNGHSRYAPSASKRWINCPGSLALCDKVPPQEDSEYAAEGTAAHELGEKALLQNKNAADFMGQTMNEKYVVDKEMADAVQVYLDAVRSRFPEGPFESLLNTLVFVERKFDLSWLHKGMFGKTDVFIFDPQEKLLSVVDYKHGVGVEVDPEWNSQAMIYALGALHDLWAGQTEITRKAISVMKMVEKVEIVIVQPRLFGTEEPVKTWTISAADLIYWGVHVLKAAAVATDDPNAPLHVTAECRFCPALAVCPAQAENALMLAKTQFTDPIFPAPDQLTPETIAKIMSLAQVFDKWVGEVQGYAQKQMECGMRIPGYKLVKKKSNREWIDEIEAGLRLKGILGDAAYVQKLLSVKQAEDAIKKLKIVPDPLAGLWQKPDNGVSIAPESDKRPAVSAPAALEFLDSADFLK